MIAFLLAYECRHLLIGERADPQVVEAIAQLLDRRDEVHEVRRLLTMQMAPDQVLVNVDVLFDQALSADEIGRAVDRLECDLRHQHPHVRQVFVEASAPGRSIEIEQAAERQGLA